MARLRESGAIILGRHLTHMAGIALPLTAHRTRAIRGSATARLGGSRRRAAAPRCYSRPPHTVPTARARFASGSLPRLFAQAELASCRPIRLAVQHPGASRPAARTVSDAALMLSVIGQPDERDMTVGTPSRPFGGLQEGAADGMRGAHGGYLRRSSGVAAVTRGLATFAEARRVVEEAAPGLPTPDRS